MSVNPYLHFAGNCAEALAFYETALGAKVNRRMTHAEAPMPSNPEWADKIMHADFSILGSQLMAADTPPEHYQKPAGFRVTLNLSDPDTAQAWFEALSTGGHIDMPLQKTFWAAAFGMVTDRFNIPWMVNCT
ncbi:MAG TPA: VOC family protein [Acidocella sp.]|jgi:PhnB protein|nr:VOC family protein [Acidocella sp.]